MFCNQCGAKNPDGAKFCCGCGSKMNGNSEQAVQSMPQQVFMQPQIQPVMQQTGVAGHNSAAVGRNDTTVTIAPNPAEWKKIKKGSNYPIGVRKKLAVCGSKLIIKNHYYIQNAGVWEKRDGSLAIEAGGIREVSESTNNNARSQGLKFLQDVGNKLSGLIFVLLILAIIALKIINVNIDSKTKEIEQYYEQMGISELLFESYQEVEAVLGAGDKTELMEMYDKYHSLTETGSKVANIYFMMVMMLCICGFIGFVYILIFPILNAGNDFMVISFDTLRGVYGMGVSRDGYVRFITKKINIYRQTGVLK